MTRSVLAGIDGSAQSTAAAHWAADEARRRGVPLRLLHVRTWLDDTRPAAEDVPDHRSPTGRMLSAVEREIRETHPALDVRVEVVESEEPVDVLVEAADEAELLVLGSRGLGGFAGLLVGSVGLAAAAHGNVPTVLVPAAAAGRPAGAQVVVGVDTRAPAADVLDFAFHQAAERGAALRAVHAWTPPPVWGYAGWVAPASEAEQFRVIESELLTRAMTGWQEKYPTVAVVEDCRIDGAAGALVDLSAEAALVVVGRRRRPHRAGLRLGPVAHAVLHHAHAPVAVVPHD
ncbi:universal stress protein [Kitasatospora cinereorecta]|uniref:Universal stress protein n=1 Tax=Kitasatospora cinereorecta TaxID=285560 RepID=A0ABW0V3S9_9ACTN